MECFLPSKKKKWGFSLFHSCLSCLFNFKEVRGFTRGGNVETWGGGTGRGVAGNTGTKKRRFPKIMGGESFSLFFFLFGGVVLLVFDVKREGSQVKEKKKKKKKTRKTQPQDKG